MAHFTFLPRVSNAPLSDFSWNFVTAVGLKKYNDALPDLKKSLTTDTIPALDRRTDSRQMDRQECHNNVALCMLTRDKKMICIWGSYRKNRSGLLFLRHGVLVLVYIPNVYIVLPFLVK